MITTQLGALIAEGKDPCARCSFFRRGAIFRFAREHGYNRVALAHHHDDAVETFLMSILYSGKIQTFLPRTDLEDGLTLIRPLVYLREAEIRKNLDLTGFTPVSTGCPLRERHPAAGSQRAVAPALPGKPLRLPEPFRRHARRRRPGSLAPRTGQGGDAGDPPEVFRRRKGWSW